MSDQYEFQRRIKEEMVKIATRQRWIAVGVVKKVRKKDKKVVVRLQPDDVDTNWLRVYFTNANGSYHTGQLPEVGSEVVLLFLGANPSTAIVLAGGMLSQGENGLDLPEDYAFVVSDKFGNKILMTNEGIEISTNKDVNINATGNVKINNGVLPVARQTDTVASPFGPLVITQVGQTKFLG